METDAENGAHRGLDHLGIEEIHRVRGGKNPIQTEPVGDAQDGAQIAGVADAVQRQIEAFFRHLRRFEVFRFVHQGKGR